MASAKDPFSILNNDPDRGKVIPQYNPTKIERYRPGKAPNWGEESEDKDTLQVNAIVKQTISIDTIESLPKSEPIPQPNLPQKSSRRQELKMKALQKHKNIIVHEEFQEPPAIEEEYEENPEEIEAPRLQPTFVPKDKRITIQEKEQMEMDEQEILEKLKQLREERKSHTKYIVAEALLREEMGEASKDEELSDEDEDDPNEFAMWKIREIKRIMKAKEERETRDKELKEIERRRGLSDWERMEEDKALGTDESAKPEKMKIGFMQKYYNKGVFYQERDEHGKLHPLFMRDYNTPVEGDFDKSALPQILQKRRGDFGKKGQSKYTHLTNEDTNVFDPQLLPQEELFLKQQMKGAGFKSMNRFDVSRKS